MNMTKRRIGLLKKILINKANGKEIYKNYYIAYEFEKFNIIRTLHDKCGHKGINTLYNLIRESDFYWSGIYNDIVNYVNKCKICQATHTSKYKSPINLQIISNKPKERYVVDITEIDENIRDKKYKFKYILNIIEHFTKLCGSYLLINKTSEEVLINIDDFINKYGTSEILQADKGKQFANEKLEAYFQKRNIKIHYIFYGI